MTFTTTGLVIREHCVGETDRIITVLTPDHGLIRAFAMGARKYINTSVSSTQMLCFSTFTFTKRKDTYRVKEAKAIEVFFELRNDIGKLCLAQYFCETVRHFSAEEENCSEALRLVLNCLKFLCKDKMSEKLIKAIYELRLLCIAGYMPDLSGCAGCGDNQKRLYFSPLDGSLFCESCTPTRAIEMPPSALRAAQHICYSPFEKVFSFRLEEQSVEFLAKMSEKFLVCEAERKFSTLDFYNSLGVHR